MEISFSIDTIEQAVIKVWQKGKGSRVWAFYGEMGAGKTTFIHKLCETLGVTSTVSSPTYALINEYESKIAGIIYHMDWYRIQSVAEAMEAGIEDCIYSGNYCFIEWPQKAEELLPENVFRVSLTLIDFDMRSIITATEHLE